MLRWNMLFLRRNVCMYVCLACKTHDVWCAGTRERKWDVGGRFARGNKGLVLGLGLMLRPSWVQGIKGA